AKHIEMHDPLAPHLPEVPCEFLLPVRSEDDVHITPKIRPLLSPEQPPNNTEQKYNHNFERKHDTRNDESQDHDRPRRDVEAQFDCRQEGLQVLWIEQYGAGRDIDD